MRRRVGSLLFLHYGQNLNDLLNRELGTKLSNLGSGTEAYWPAAMETVELRDVLDAITLVARRFDRINIDFINEIRRIFAEERVRYSVDDQGGVHFSVDVEFEQTRVSAIRVLGSSRYKSIREHFEAAYRALDGVPPDPKQALRSIFFANEGLFRLIFPSAAQLSGAELQKQLRPKLDQVYGSQKPAVHVAHKQLAQFADWIDGAHFYRHEPGTEEPVQPPIEMAIHYVATGAAWLRWLCAFDGTA